MSRMDKLNQLFKREIGSMLLMGEISDPRVKFVTVTFADVSKDLSYAHVGFSILSDRPDDVARAQAGLDSARGRLRKLIGERVDLRHIPEIKFVYDDTIVSSIQMTKTLEELHRERDVQDPAGPEPLPENRS
ncbi:MAG: 30S ribosome-binding factor RbfA [Candidatus Omnitrophica bacterium]|nr:30S ribosome-binding factor RbfA [Candidatus Omnitrophota bacterium]